MERFRTTDFAVDGFKNDNMNRGNLAAFVDCLYRLRTRLRTPVKRVYAGGVHYPTLIVTNHLTPPVSTSGAQYCWLDERGVGPNGLTPETCCDTSQGPRGMEACWDDHFTYELCCRGDVALGELPHFFVGPAFDINVANAVRQLGTFDLGQSYALQTLCRRGDLVLDVGANIGGFTVPLAERVGASGEVHAFEPFRRVYQHLNANVALNGLSNVFAHNVALGRSPKRLDVFTADLHTFNFPSAMRVEDQIDHREAEAHNVKYAPDQERIEIRTLDSFSFDRRIALIKIDVEFMELEVVMGGLETIRRHQPVMWVENENFFDEPSNTTFVDTMAAELGYECKAVARLELLCRPEGRQEGEGFHRVFRHLSGEVKDDSLWKALTEADPNYLADMAPPEPPPA